MLEIVEQLTDYEIERGKPIPSFNHSILQSRIIFLLNRDFDKEFTFPSELELGFIPKGAVPDICVYSKVKRDYKQEDILKMMQPPITTIEILSPKQALNGRSVKSTRYLLS